MKKTVIGKKLVLAIIVSGALAACGGGSDDAGTGTGSGTGSGASSYVTGAFKNATETGDFFNKKDIFIGDTDFHGFLSESCKVQNDYYFESDRVQVYGERGLPEEDFKKVATWVEAGFNAAAAKMATSFDEVMNSRQNLHARYVPLAVFAVQAQRATGIEYPANFKSLDSEDRERFAIKYVSSTSYQHRVDIALEELMKNGKSLKENDVSYGKKIRVCLHKNSTNSFQYGEAIFNGMNIAAPSISTPKGYQQIVEHEMVHMIQLALSHSNNPNVLSRWFSEGQAVYLSGQEIAAHKDHYALDTPRFRFFSDESGRNPTDLYKHYGLAYKYIHDANGIAPIKKMLQSLKHTNHLSVRLEPGYESIGTDMPIFLMAWDDAGLKTKDGEPLKLSRWIRDYHVVMEKN